MEERAEYDTGTMPDWMRAAGSLIVAMHTGEIKGDVSVKRVAVTPEELAAWQKSLGVGRPQAARLLRTPYTTYVDWSDGKKTPPACLSLAMAYVALLVEAGRK